MEPRPGRKFLETLVSKPVFGYFCPATKVPRPGAKQLLLLDVGCVFLSERSERNQRIAGGRLRGILGPRATIPIRHRPGPPLRGTKGRGWAVQSGARRGWSARFWGPPAHAAEKSGKKQRFSHCAWLVRAVGLGYLCRTKAHGEHAGALEFQRRDFLCLVASAAAAREGRSVQKSNRAGP